MNKRGQEEAGPVPKETLNIIIAVICILGLIALAVALYVHYTKNQDLENAKSSLTKLVSDINSGLNQSQIYNPTDWLLMSFYSADTGYFPKVCTANGWTKCLCMCVNDVGAAANPTCDNDGTCQQSDFFVNGQTSLGAGWNIPI